MNYGWEPMGTGPPRGYLKKDWDGSCAYWGNEGQLFYARDAENLATALDRFLTTPELAQTRRTKRQNEMLSLGRSVAKSVEEIIHTLSKPAIRAKQKKSKRDQDTQSPRLTDDEREYIKQFISFCRNGSFRIH